MPLVLASGPVAAASHRSAAALLAIPGFDRAGPVEVITPRLRRHRDSNHRVHRWRALPDHHLTVVEGIATTRVARTLVDLAGVLPQGRTVRAVDNYWRPAPSPSACCAPPSSTWPDRDARASP